MGLNYALQGGIASAHSGLQWRAAGNASLRMMSGQ
jgi:hypothetical protein